jgi:hypothetical protein
MDDDWAFTVEFDVVLDNLPEPEEEGEELDEADEAEEDRRGDRGEDRDR